MAGDLSGAAVEARNLAQRIGSNAADAVSFAADLGEELPFLSPVLKTLKATQEKVATVRSNREELAALAERCTYVTACVVVKCRQNPSSEMDVSPLENCVEAIRKFVERCSRRGKVSRVFKASSDRDEIAGLNASVDRLMGDLGLAGIAVLEGKTDKMTAMLVRHRVSAVEGSPRGARTLFGCESTPRLRVLSCVLISPNPPTSITGQCCRLDISDEATPPLISYRQANLLLALAVIGHPYLLHVLHLSYSPPHLCF